MKESHTRGQQRSLGIQIHIRSPLGTDTLAAVHTCGLGLFGRKSAGLNQRQKYHGCHWEFRNSDKLSKNRGGRFEQEIWKKCLKYLKYSGKMAGVLSSIRRKDPRASRDTPPTPNL